jgi:hypothetical protein
MAVYYFFALLIFYASLLQCVRVLALNRIIQIFSRSRQGGELNKLDKKNVYVVLQNEQLKRSKSSGIFISNHSIRICLAVRSNSMYFTNEI